MTNSRLPTVVLTLAAVAAFLLANSPLADTYQHLIHFEFDLNLFGIAVHAPLHFIVNDILMAIFFLAVGCEIKRELLVGQLSTIREATFPVIGAIGGMLIPALIFLAINSSHEANLRGWPIPSATDIAFSLGVLGFVTGVVPKSLRVFLTALAIVDDLGAVLIIAIFFSGSLAPTYLALIGVLAVVLSVLQRLKNPRLIYFLIFSPLVWLAFHLSGIHATVAGVFLAMFVPLRNNFKNEPCLEKLEHGLVPYVVLLILPIFAFFNSGISIAGMKPEMLLDAVPLGVALGLFLGKQFGVFVFCYLADRLGVAKKADDANWVQLYSIALLTGIGFTMSIFVAGLAFPDALLLTEAKLGIFVGSILSAVFGLLLLNRSTKTLAKVP